jgi:hypothetical protein
MAQVRSVRGLHWRQAVAGDRRLKATESGQSGLRVGVVRASLVRFDRVRPHRRRGCRFRGGTAGHSPLGWSSALPRRTATRERAQSRPEVLPQLCRALKPAVGALPTSNDGRSSKVDVSRVAVHDQVEITGVPGSHPTIIMLTRSHEYPVSQRDRFRSSRAQLADERFGDI